MERHRHDIAVVFDLDGTLVDSTVDIHTSINLTLREFDLPQRSLEDVVSYIGDGVSELVRRSLADHQDLFEAALASYKNHYAKHCLDTTRLYPHIREMLGETARDWTLFVVSNKNEGMSRTILEGLGIANYFSDVVGGDTLPEKKPSPAAVHHLAKRYNIPPERMVVVGDHSTDMLMGERAGCRTIFCNYGIGVVGSSHPHFRIDSPSDLAPLLRRM